MRLIFSADTIKIETDPLSAAGTEIGHDLIVLGRNLQDGSNP
jgi:hypothetical protein